MLLEVREPPFGLHPGGVKPEGECERWGPNTSRSISLIEHTVVFTGTPLSVTQTLVRYQWLVLRYRGARKHAFEFRECSECNALIIDMRSIGAQAKHRHFSLRSVCQYLSPKSKVREANP